jgi:predicted HicB family RNase H-like nuclease
MMNRDAPFTAKIAFRLPQALHDRLTLWAAQEDRPLANLIYTLVKQAATEHDREMHEAELHKETNR